MNGRKVSCAAMLDVLCCYVVESLRIIIVIVFYKKRSANGGSQFDLVSSKYKYWLEQFFP